MKKLNLYQVYDNVGQEVITNVIPSASDLTAALGFRNSYILEKDKRKNPYQYKALDLKKVAEMEIDESGLVVSCQPAKWTITGGMVMDFIQAEMKELGVDDFLLDEETEEENK